ncbi:MAG: type I methionyl aminopeptidase [Bacteroidales bacterium]|nr:type I methionyl aminopeptidase [Bacteroidales bacterium]MBD5215308.1 type I methionyl aminopeptidase [Bacteroidales bacterium]MBD5219238.1 type I methionyl aminopeptidase [Bacteroidales bacterium]
MIYLKTPEEIEKMRAAARLVSQTLGEVARWIEPGVTTRKLDTIAREFILDNGGKPACLGYGGFPATLCIEVNETVVHGFPSDRVLMDGDIIGVDTVVELDGYNGDSAYTFAVGTISPEKKRLCQTTREALYVGIDACKPGARIGDIANAIQTYCEHRNYSVVREMCGHGIGRKMHEDPEVPNYGRRGIGPRLQNGMCFCIEPMINMGSRNIVISPDGWECLTRDRKPSAHYEHTLAMVNDRVEILTTFDYIHEAITDKFI